VWTNVISSPSDAEAWTVGGSKRKSRRNELESYASAAVRTRRFFYARNAVPPETGAGANQPEVKKNGRRKQTKRGASGTRRFRLSAFFAAPEVIPSPAPPLCTLTQTGDFEHEEESFYR